MNEPLVSIITVTYNIIKNSRLDYLFQCVDSVKTQNYKNIEHIIIDGASNDGTIDFLKKYEDGGQIKLLSEPDAGIYDAMNKGIKLAKGKYITFLNSDDFYHNKNGIGDSVSALEKSGAIFSYAPVTNYDDKKGKKTIIHPDISRIFFSIALNHQTMIFERKTILKEGIFNTKYHVIADYDLTLRLCLKNYNSTFVRTNFVTYRLGGFSLDAQNSGEISKELKRIYINLFSKKMNITKTDCKRLSEELYNNTLQSVPLNLALSLRDYSSYFNFKKYVELLDEIRKNDNKVSPREIYLQQQINEILESKSWKIAKFISKLAKILHLTRIS